MHANAAMKTGINQVTYRGTRPAIQHRVKIPASRPSAPPVISAFSSSTTPCTISANGTITSAKANIIGHASMPLISMNPRQKKVEAMALYPTADQIRDDSLSE